MFDLESEGISVEEAMSGRHILEKFLESSVMLLLSPIYQCLADTTRMSGQSK